MIGRGQKIVLMGLPVNIIEQEVVSENGRFGFEILEVQFLVMTKS